MYEIIKFVDKNILNIIIYLFPRRNNKPKKIQNILFIKLWALGDSVNTLPLIKAVKNKYKTAKITVLTSKNNIKIYEHQPFIDEIINIKNIKKLFKRYDIVFDLEPYLNFSAILSRILGRTAIGFSGQKRSRLYDFSTVFHKHKHIVKTYLELGEILNIKTNLKLIKLKYSINSERKTAEILTKLSGKILIGFCASVGSNIKEREWPKKNFRELAERLLKKNRKIIILLIGSSHDYELNEYIKNNNPRILNLSGMLDLEMLFCLLKKFDVFISNDTGPMHMSAAQGVKTIGLFGPNTPDIWAPLGKKCVSIFHPKPGCPFIDNTSHRLIPSTLTEEQKTCMDAITVDEVYDVVIKLLGKSTGKGYKK